MMRRKGRKQVLLDSDNLVASAQALSGRKGWKCRWHLKDGKPANSDSRVDTAQF